MITMAMPSPEVESSSPPAADWHIPFLQLLPGIRRQANFCFRRLSADDREEAVQQVIANALHAFVQLWHEGGAPGFCQFAGAVCRGPRARWPLPGAAAEPAGYHVAPLSKSRPAHRELA